jgi:hypothetical protein
MTEMSSNISVATTSCSRITAVTSPILILSVERGPDRPV